MTVWPWMQCTRGCDKPLSAAWAYSRAFNALTQEDLDRHVYREMEGISRRVALCVAQLLQIDPQKRLSPGGALEMLTTETLPRGAYFSGAPVEIGEETWDGGSSPFGASGSEELSVVHGFGESDRGSPEIPEEISEDPLDKSPGDIPEDLPRQEIAS